MGHKSTVCTSKPGNMIKNIFIENVSVRALVDTGSELNLVRDDIYEQLKINRYLLNTE